MILTVMPDTLQIDIRQGKLMHSGISTVKLPDAGLGYTFNARAGAFIDPAEVLPDNVIFQSSSPVEGIAPLKTNVLFIRLNSGPQAPPFATLVNFSGCQSRLSKRHISPSVPSFAEK